MKKRKQKGRPRGSSCNVRIRLDDINKYLTGHSTIPVSRTWLDAIGFGIDESEVIDLKVVKETPENTKIETSDLV